MNSNKDIYFYIQVLSDLVDGSDVDAIFEWWETNAVQYFTKHKWVEYVDKNIRNGPPAYPTSSFKLTELGKAMIRWNEL